MSNNNSNSKISSKRIARERIHDLVVEDKKQRKSLLNAYVVKKQVIENELLPIDQSENYLIRSSDPIIIPPEGKYSHTQGALICSKPYNPSKTQSIGNSHSDSKFTCPSNSPVVKKLTSLEAFPTTYIKRIESTFNENEHGDIVDMSKKTSKLLKDAPASSLYTPTRASDFRSEIRWRLMLRDSH